MTMEMMGFWFRDGGGGPLASREAFKGGIFFVRFKEIFGGEDQQIRQFAQNIHYNFIQEMKVTLTDALGSPIIQIFCSGILRWCLSMSTSSMTLFSITLPMEILKARLKKK